MKRLLIFLIVLPAMTLGQGVTRPSYMDASGRARGSVTAVKFSSTADSGTDAFTAVQGAKLTLGAGSLSFNGTALAATVGVSAPSFTSTAASESNAFVAAQGAKLMLGTASISFDGTSVATTAGVSSPSVTTTATTGNVALSGANGSKFCPGANTACITSDGSKLTLPTTAIGATTITGLTVSTYFKVSVLSALMTCDATYHGTNIPLSVAGSGTRTRWCQCTSDNAVSPSYAWVNAQTGAVGTNTNCP